MTSRKGREEMMRRQFGQRNGRKTDNAGNKWKCSWNILLRGRYIQTVFNSKRTKSNRESSFELVS